MSWYRPCRHRGRCANMWCCRSSWPTRSSRTRSRPYTTVSASETVYHTDVKSISENEYLKIDVVDKKVDYSVETYEVKFTNRSDYTVVIADGFEQSEVQLQLQSEVRDRSDSNQTIVLEPKDSLAVYFTFPKFVDDGEKSKGLLFPSIRVLEKYSGKYADKEILKSEVNNAIAKFSMTVGL